MLNEEKKREELIALKKTMNEDEFTQAQKVKDFNNGEYDDHDYLTPWTKASDNLNAKVMIVGKDWSSINKLESYDENWEKRDQVVRDGYDKDFPTNRNLKYFIDNSFKKDLKWFYSTNLYIFIKEGQPDAKISKRELSHSAETYLIPQIKIIQPQWVICLGRKEVHEILYQAITGKKDYNQLIENINSNKKQKWYNIPPITKELTTDWGSFSPQIIGLPHPGARGINNVAPPSDFNGTSKEYVIELWKQAVSLIN